MYSEVFVSVITGTHVACLCVLHSENLGHSFMQLLLVYIYRCNLHRTAVIWVTLRSSLFMQPDG